MTKRKTEDRPTGTDIFEDRGRRFGTKVQETPMSGSESGNRFGYRSGKVGDIEDSINSGKRK